MNLPGIFTPDLPVSPARYDPASTSIPPTPFHPLETPLYPRLQPSPKSIPRDPARRKGPKILSVFRLRRFLIVRDGWLFFQPSEKATAVPSG